MNGLTTKLVIYAGSAFLGGCAFIPVQHTTIAEPGGGAVTCTERGAGVFSYWIGKYKYDNCMEDAKNMGEGLNRLIGQPLTEAIQKLGSPSSTLAAGTETVYVWEKDGCTIKGDAQDGRLMHADYEGDHSDCRSYRETLARP